MILVFLFSLLSSNVYLLSAAEQKPERIVSINLCADELLLRVADTSQVQGVTRFEKSPEATAILKSSLGISQLHGNAEEVLALHPDLVLAGRFTDSATRSMLQRFQVPLMVLDVPKNFEEIYANFEKVGKAVGHRDKAEAQISEMKLQLSRLDLRGGKQPSTKSRIIFFQRGGHVPGAHTFEEAILQAAGARNLASDLGIQGYGMLSVEDLIIQKPDLILFPGDQGTNPSVEREMIHHPAIEKALPGIRTLNVPSYTLNCGSPSSIEAVKMIRDQL